MFSIVIMQRFRFQPKWSWPGDTFFIACDGQATLTAGYLAELWGQSQIKKKTKNRNCVELCDAE